VVSFFVSLSLLRTEKLLPKRQNKARVEAKLRSRLRAEENFISAKAASVRETQRWELGLSSSNWESDSDSEGYVSDGSFESVSSFGDTPPKVPKRLHFSKRIRNLRLLTDVSSVQRLVSKEGRWPLRTHFSPGTYLVGPSRIELEFFRRKQLIFLEIDHALRLISPLSWWYDYKSELARLKSLVFKYLKTGTRGKYSVEQRYLLRNITFLQRGLMSP
jgi:hypothetical protein